VVAKSIFNGLIVEYGSNQQANRGAGKSWRGQHLFARFMTGFRNPCCIIDSCSYYKPSKTKEQEQKWSSSNVPNSAPQDGLTILNHVVCLTQPPVQKPSS
jgi:hypothetical protein